MQNPRICILAFILIAVEDSAMCPRLIWQSRGRESSPEAYSHRKYKYRYTKFKMGKHREEAMPPNQDSLKQHIMRANYQAAVYKSALDQFPDIPSPHGRGWIVAVRVLLYIGLT
ncbi:uncharacterized protein [Amphiura filiformis]|uniref:uncharacterized protein n=1 Tax=Amphiura filiformis TaxID=82378 RepID=UPI003B20F37E